VNELLAMLAVAYVTYVIVESHFPPIAWVRDAILDRVADGGSILYLLTCWWCTGFWTAVIIVGSLWALNVSLHVPVLLVLAGALVAGMTGAIFGVLEMMHANLVKGLNRE
jgi:hypothetical protein